MESIILDAQEMSAAVETSGKRLGNEGSFFEPTVLTDVRDDARIVHEEPFRSVAVMTRFTDVNEILSRANSLSLGLASYAFTSSAKTAAKLADSIDTGMLTINYFEISLPQTAFGGIKDSGYSDEDGIEGLSAYLRTKFFSHLA